MAFPVVHKVLKTFIFGSRCLSLLLWKIQLFSGLNLKELSYTALIYYKKWQIFVWEPCFYFCTIRCQISRWTETDFVVTPCPVVVMSPLKLLFKQSTLLWYNLYILYLMERTFRVMSLIFVNVKNYVLFMLSAIFCEFLNKWLWFDYMPMLFCLNLKWRLTILRFCEKITGSWCILSYNVFIYYKSRLVCSRHRG